MGSRVREREHPLDNPSRARSGLRRDRRLALCRLRQILAEIAPSRIDFFYPENKSREQATRGFFLTQLRIKRRFF